MSLTSNTLRNIIRTAVPAAWGYVVTLLALLVHHFPLAYQRPAVAVATLLWYALFRNLEKRFKFASFFLGALPVQYDPPVLTPPVTEPVATVTSPPPEPPTQPESPTAPESVPAAASAPA